MRRRHHRSRSHTDWGEYHAAERHRVSSLYGGINADVRQVFFELPAATLERVFADYKEKNGQSAYAYAKRVYADWKSGKVQMSGQIGERLLAIVPRHLDFAVKYNLLEKLCRCREGTRLRVELTHDMTASEAIGTVLRAIETARSTSLPEHIVKRMHWLADNDGTVARSLLNHVFDREYEVIVRSVQQELLRLLSLRSDLAGKPVELHVQREITLPGVTVQIVLSNSTLRSKPRSVKVSDELQNQLPKPTDGGLAPVPRVPTSGQVVPIQNPQNLLEEALKWMPPEKQAEVLSKAADEALRLQVKHQEHVLNTEIVSDQIDQAARVAGVITGNPNANISTRQ